MIKSTNDNIWVVRDIPESESGGLLIPDSAKPKVHKGKIISVGKLVSDDTIKEGGTAIFNKTSGFELTETGVEYTVLRQIDIIGTQND